CRTANIVLAIGGLNGFVSTEVQNSTFVLRLNVSAKNPAHRQYAARYIELCKLLRYPKGFSASKGIVDIFGGASRPSSLGGETVQVRSIPLVDVSETSQRLDEVSRYQPQNQALTDKKIKILQSGTGFPCWLSSHSFYPGIKSHGWN